MFVGNAVCTIITDDRTVAMTASTDRRLTLDGLGHSVFDLLAAFPRRMCQDPAVPVLVEVLRSLHLGLLATDKRVGAQVPGLLGSHSHSYCMWMKDIVQAEQLYQVQVVPHSS